jgi:uncharacterized protein (TIRG00374 family)
VSKKTLWNLVKYALALLLLTWVVLLNWDPRKHSWETFANLVGDSTAAVGKIFQGKDGVEVRDTWTRSIEDAARFKLTSQSLTDLRKAQVPEEVVTQITPLLDKGFDTEQAFLEEVGQVLSPAALQQDKANLLKAAEKIGLAYVVKRHFLQTPAAPVHWEYLGLAFIICLAATLLTFVRWFVLVRAVNLPFTVTNAMRLGMIGYFFNTFLPGSVGGDIVKAAFLAREHSRRTVAVATVLMDRVLALWAFICFVAVAGTIFYLCGMLEGEGMQASLWMTIGSGAAVLSSLVFWVLLGYLPQWRVDKFAWRLEHQIPKIGPSLAEFWRAVWMYRCQPRAVALTMVMTWIGEVGFILVFYFSVLTLWSPEYGRIPSLAEHLLLVPIGLVVMAIPLFPGGVGIGELGFGGLYATMGCVASLAVLGSLVQRVVMWGLALLGFLVYQRMKPAIKAATQTQPTTAPSLPSPPPELATAKG